MCVQKVAKRADPDAMDDGYNIIIISYYKYTYTRPNRPNVSNLNL